MELMTFALTWCANIFVECSVTPTFFRQITSFSDSFHYTKKQKNLCVVSFNYFSYTIDVIKFQTSELLILLKFYFHDV